MLAADMLQWDPSLRHLTLTLHPNQQPHPSSADIERVFQHSRFNVLQPQPREWQAGLDRLNQSTSAVTIEIAKAVDGYWQLELSPDYMELTASLTLPCGGQAASINDLLLLLKQKKIERGLSRSAIIGLFERHKQGNPGSTYQQVIASGKPPQHGQDGYLEKLVTLASERHLTPQARDVNRVDMRDLGSNYGIERGQPLMRRHPPTTGADGYDLLGRPLAAHVGHPVPLVAGSGTIISDQDPDLLLATCAGMPIAVANGMAVEEQLQLAQVDIRSGHINFNGSVEITGNVDEGMKVIASGNIVVRGIVEGASLQAGGNIEVHQGVIGRQRDDGSLNCQLAAGGDIKVKRAQFCQLQCFGNIEVQLQCSHSQLRSDGTVHVGEPGRMQGGLYGGVVEARLGCTCVELGTKAGAETTVKVGTDYSKVKSKLDQLLQQRTEFSKQIIATQAQQKQKLREGAEQAEIERLKTLVEEYKQQFSDNSHAIDEQQQKLDEFYNQIDIKVLKQLFPRVLLVVGQERQLTEKEHGPSQAFVDHSGFNLDAYIPAPRRRK